MPFLIDLLPGALKRYRHYAQTAHETGGLPQLAIALLFLHLYMVLRNRSGVRYQVIAARAWGATLDEVLSTIHLGFVNGGPLAANTAAEAATDLLRDWPRDAPRTVDAPWPDEWDAPPDVREPDDATTRPGIRFLERHAPTLVGSWRSRMDHLERTWALPAQVRQLMIFHSAAARGHAIDAAAAASRAREGRVSKGAAVETFAFAMLYLDDTALDGMCAVLDPVFAEWD